MKRRGETFFAECTESVAGGKNSAVITVISSQKNKERFKKEVLVIFC